MSEIDRLTGIAAGWRLRAIALEECGVMLAGKCLRECAEELEAALQKREATRLSWYRHEHGAPTGTPPGESR